VRLLLLGVSHHTAPLAIRERLAVDDPVPVLGKLLEDEELDEAVLLSTCNRTEVLVLTRDVEAARRRLHHLFQVELPSATGGISGGEIEEYLYELQDGEAMRHLLRVASALDSMVMGEPQILGQTKDAYRAAVTCGASGPILDRLFQRAFSTAKRVRSETRLAERPTSVARVAARLAGQIFEDFSEKQALMVGAGEMIELALAALRDRGLDRLAVANRSAERASALAVQYGGSAHGLDELPALLAEADMVLTCIALDRPVITSVMLWDALRGRRGRPLFVIDIGVPRNVDPAVDVIDEVYRYDLDDLASMVDENVEERQREQARAEVIISEEQQNFDGWFVALRAVPTIKDVRARIEEIRSSELERSLGKLALDESQREGVEALTQAMVNKILHAPLTRLRREAEREEGLVYLEVARLLFGLDDEDSEGGGESP